MCLPAGGRPHLVPLITILGVQAPGPGGCWPPVSSGNALLLPLLLTNVVSEAGLGGMVSDCFLPFRLIVALSSRFSLIKVKIRDLLVEFLVLVT